MSKPPVADLYWVELLVYSIFMWLTFGIGALLVCLKDLQKLYKDTKNKLRVTQEMLDDLINKIQEK